MTWRQLTSVKFIDWGLGGSGIIMLELSLVRVQTALVKYDFKS